MSFERTVKLFARLQGLYGSAWTGQWKTADDRRVALATWQQELAPFADPVVARAAERVATLHVERPPNAPQFRQLCKRLQEIYDARGGGKAKALADQRERERKAAAGGWSDRVRQLMADTGLQSLPYDKRQRQDGDQPGAPASRQRVAS